ncbi:MAG TPA: universal stress protein [Candidatus Acidoferrum sp.]|nr:universal stress protein [Candidatus Acidoferrum sp.]
MKNIILAIDKGSSGGAAAVTARLSRRLDARVTVVHVGSRFKQGGDALEAAVKSLKRSGVTFEIRLEQPASGAGVAESLVNTADELRADMIVLGSRGRSAPVASLFGSVSREVARSAHVPVLVVRRAPRQPGPSARLMIVVTEETLGSLELDAGIELARGLKARVTILHIHGPLESAVADLLKVPQSRRPDHIANLLLARFGAAGVEAKLVVADNRDGLAKEITRAALDAGCDLIVVPAGTTDAAERWVLGTVDEEVGRRSGSPVLVAPPIRKTRAGRGGL